MKNYRKIILAVACGIILYGVNPMNAQNNNHWVKAHLGVGYGNLFHGIDNTKVPGGVEFGGGVGYEFNRDRLLLSIGAEFMYLGSKTNLFDYVEHRDYQYLSRTEDGTPVVESDGLSSIPIYFNYNFLTYSEKHKLGMLNVPIQVGMTFSDRFYAMIGAKVGFALMANYDLNATVKTTATDPRLISDLEDVGSHHLTTTEFAEKRKLDLGLNLAPTVEFGVILDEWLSKRFLQLNNNRRTPLSYRVALVADYSILNMNKSSTNRGLFTEPGKDPLDITMNGMMASELVKGKRVGNLYVGAKVSVLFKMNKDKPKKKRTPPPPRAPRPAPPTFNGKIVDAETNEDMQAVLIITKQPENRQVFKGLPNKRTGLVSRRLTAGTYDLSVSVEGYMNYMETIEITQTDTVLIAMEKIKKEEPIIMHDLLFELNSAIINPVSEPSLDELAERLLKNPQVNIEFIGHTDNTGQPAYNQRLSEERAKAVFEAMVKRGVEASRMTYSGRGANEPIATNDTEEGRATNRRVVFIFR